MDWKKIIACVLALGLAYLGGIFTGRGTLQDDLQSTRRELNETRDRLTSAEGTLRTTGQLLSNFGRTVRELEELGAKREADYRRLEDELAERERIDRETEELYQRLGEAEGGTILSINRSLGVVDECRRLLEEARGRDEEEAD